MKGQSDSHSRFDQARGLRRLMSRHPAPGGGSASTQIIAVASGKGGVGKTLISANLAIALAARGHRVVLFDMDMGLANTDIVLGVDPKCTWTDVLSGRRSLEDVIVQAPGQIAFVPGASGVAQLANLSEFERRQLMVAMERIESDYDVLIMDCGAGISQNVIGFANSADTVLVVATPEPTAVTDAYAVIKALARDWAAERGPADPLTTLGVIVNLADSRREGRETYERLASVAARFLHVPITDYGYILRDEHVSSAVKQRSPVILRYPRCPASACLMASAARLSREMGQPEASKSLFYRVMNMFL